MRSLLTATCILLASICHADKIDDIVKKHMWAKKIPGVALMVLRDGKPLKMKGYGFANLEHKVLVKPETIFQSGSIGKQFTSMLVMMLVQDGKLGLDDPISKYFPEAGGLWEGVQVRHLLSHTSGLAGMRYRKMDLRKDYTEAELVRLMSDTAPISKPGEKWSYFNGGYVLLGILVKRLTSKFYGDLLRDRVFKTPGNEVCEDYQRIGDRSQSSRWLRSGSGRNPKSELGVSSTEHNRGWIPVFKLVRLSEVG